MAIPETPSQTRRRPPPGRRKLLLTLHVVATAGLIGTALVLVVLGIASLRGADPRSIYPAAYLAEVWLTAPLALVALASGVLLGVTSTWGLFRYWWVTLKLTITAALTGVIFFVLIPRLATSAAAATVPGGAAFTATERLPLAIAPLVAVVLLVFNVALAIYKPGWRLRAGSSERRPSPLAGAGQTPSESQR